MTEPSNELLKSLLEAQGSTAYIQALGAEVTQAVTGQTTMRLPYSQKIVGNPDTGVVHVGVITGLLDHACGMAVGSALGVTFGNQERRNTTSYATLDLRIDYMRPAAPRAGVTAEAHCYKLTRSIAFVRAQAWDADPADPIATVQAAFMMSSRG